MKELSGITKSGSFRGLFAFVHSHGGILWGNKGKVRREKSGCKYRDPFDSLYPLASEIGDVGRFPGLLQEIPKRREAREALSKIPRPCSFPSEK